MGDIYRSYDSLSEMKSMACILDWTFRTRKHFFRVFCSKNHEELRHQSVTSSPNFRGTGVIKEQIIDWLRGVSIQNYLLQFWAPVTIEDRRYLTTADQPFALKELLEGLCAYKKLCVDYLIPLDDKSTEEEHLGPPGRAFRNGLPEVSLDVRHYTTQEYPLRDVAVSFGVRSYMALPVCRSSGYDFSGVVELVNIGIEPGFYELSRYILRTYMHTYVPYKAITEIHEMLEPVCNALQLRLAQTWVPISPSIHTNRVRNERRGSVILDFKLEDFADACKICYIQNGQGVVGKAFSSKGACFCKDVCQLSINEYPLVPSARKAGVTGCFAICLQHTQLADYVKDIQLADFVYIVEFFLPSNEAESGDPRTVTGTRFFVRWGQSKRRRFFIVKKEQD